MRQSRTAMSNWQSRMLILGIDPIGFANGNPVYPFCGAEGEGGSGGEGGAGASGEGGAGAGGSGGNDDGSGSEAEPPKNPDALKLWVKNRELLAEKQKRKAEADAKDAELETLRKKQKEIDDRDKSELEKASSSLAEVTSRISSLESDNSELRIENAFLKLNTDKEKYRWVDSGAAYRLLEKSGLKIDKDGTVNGLDDAIKALKKNYPFLIEKIEEKAPGSRGSTGGSFSGGDRSGDAQNNRAKLAAKYNIPS